MSAATALEGCFSEGRLNGLTLKNRFIKAGTFEGMTPGGEPSSLLEQFHCRLADGGIAMTTIGYCAVEPDGRLHENRHFGFARIPPLGERPLGVSIDERDGPCPRCLRGNRDMSRQGGLAGPAFMGRKNEDKTLRWHGADAPQSTDRRRTASSATGLRVHHRGLAATSMTSAKFAESFR